jgi:PadR family transcriptional regulator, regulatory protein PadR
MVRRAAGSLLPLELDLLAAGVALARSGEPEFHGYAVAATLADATGAKRLTAHGTLYKALGRLGDAGLLESRWEDPSVAEAEGRPRRRLYRVTGSGAAALARSGHDAVSTGGHPAHVRGRAARGPLAGPSPA